MNPIMTCYCRAFQLVFRLAMPLMPYREPERLEGIQALPPLLERLGICSVLLVTDRPLPGGRRHQDAGGAAGAVRHPLYGLRWDPRQPHCPKCRGRQGAVSGRGVSGAHRLWRRGVHGLRQDGGGQESNGSGACRTVTREMGKSWQTNGLKSAISCEIITLFEEKQPCRKQRIPAGCQESWFRQAMSQSPRSLLL